MTLHEFRQKWSPWLKTGFAIILLFILFRLQIIDPKVIANGLKRPGIVIAALIAITLGINIGAYRWQLLLRASSIETLFSRIQSMTYISLFAGVFLPIPIGADILKIYYVSRETDKQNIAAATVVADKVIGLYALLLTFLILMIVDKGNVSRHSLLYSFATVATLLIVVIPCLAIGLWSVARPLTKHINPKYKVLSISLAHYLNLSTKAYKFSVTNSSILAYALFLGVLGHILTLGSIAIVAIGLGLTNLNWQQYGIAGAIAIISNLVPISMGGLGVGEGVFDQVCRVMADTPNAEGYGSALFFWRAISLLATTPGALAYAAFRRRQHEVT